MPDSALFDIYKFDLSGSAKWMGTVHSYSVAVFHLQLASAKAPGSYAIVNRQTGERNVLSLGSSVDGLSKAVAPDRQTTLLPLI
jgi:hypothetical protein